MSWTGGPLDGRRLMMKSSVILRRYLVTTYQISKFLSIHVVPSYFGIWWPVCPSTRYNVMSITNIKVINVLWMVCTAPI
jgi:hypothetical protein